SDVGKSLREGQERRSDRHTAGQAGADVTGKESGFMTLSLFERSKDEHSISLERSAQSSAVLRACESGLVDGSKRVPRLKTLVTQESENISTPIVRAALGDDVYHA